jgi:hypothetical protein
VCLKRKQAGKRKNYHGSTFFYVVDLAFALLLTQSLDELEQQYSAMAVDAFDKYKSTFLREVIDQRIKTDKATQQLLARSKVLTFLTTCLIPKFKALEKDETEFIIGHSGFDAGDPIETNVTQTKSSFVPHLLREILHKDVLIFDEIVYPLVSVAPTSRRDLLVEVNGRILSANSRRGQSRKS